MIRAIFSPSVQATPKAAASRLDFEDSTGMCDTCPGELWPAEVLQIDPVPMQPPGPTLGSVLALTAGIAFGAIVALHLALRAFAQ
ncbi:hypothetical protein PEC18_18625 [Paucibacter sp. O1-1]|nr:hypothetical protein [Paucibacter sp. O1-1]MDA3827813.1 hypothetical protein [Paucibacter sp. O1-1]